MAGSHKLKWKESMKAVRIHEYGGNEVLRLEDIPIPNAGAGEVRVRVRATSINPVDWKTRLGYLDGGVTLPVTLGWDVAGDVDSVCQGGTHVRPRAARSVMLEVRGCRYA